MITPVIIILWLLVVICSFTAYLLYSILHIIKDNYASQNAVLINRYQQAVSTPSPAKIPGRPIVQKDSTNEIDLVDLDFETGYEALVAYGKGES